MMTTLKRGDRVVIETAGGAGNGPASARDREALAIDVADGKVSAGRAQAQYGRNDAPATNASSMHTRRWNVKRTLILATALAATVAAVGTGLAQNSAKPDKLVVAAYGGIWADIGSQELCAVLRAEDRHQSRDHHRRVGGLAGEDPRQSRQSADPCRGAGGSRQPARRQGRARWNRRRSRSCRTSPTFRISSTSRGTTFGDAEHRRPRRHVRQVGDPEPAEVVARIHRQRRRRQIRQARLDAGRHLHLGAGIHLARSRSNMAATSTKPSRS